MPRIVRYILLFLFVVILQVFLFNNLRISIYLSVFIYPAFVLLLPLEIKGWLLLLLSAGCGVVIDFLTGMPGINTAALTFMAFCRPSAVRLLIGRETIEEGGIPNVKKIGPVKFIRHTTVLVFLFCAFFFWLETLTTTGLVFTLFKVIIATLSSVAVIYFTQLLFLSQKQNG